MNSKPSFFAVSLGLTFFVALVLGLSALLGATVSVAGAICIVAAMLVLSFSIAILRLLLKLLVMCVVFVFKARAERRWKRLMKEMGVDNV